MGQALLCLQSCQTSIEVEGIHWRRSLARLDRYVCFPHCHPLTAHFPFISEALRYLNLVAGYPAGRGTHKFKPINVLYTHKPKSASIKCVSGYFAWEMVRYRAIEPQGGSPIA